MQTLRNPNLQLLLHLQPLSCLTCFYLFIFDFGHWSDLLILKLLGGHTEATRRSLWCAREKFFQNGCLWRSFADVLKHVHNGLDQIIVYVYSLLALIPGAFFLPQVRILCQPMIGLQRACTNNTFHHCPAIKRTTIILCFLPFVCNCKPYCNRMSLCTSSRKDL